MSSLDRALHDVAHFHNVFGQPIVDKPALPSIERRELRERLLQEEFTEYMQASANDDIVEVADAIADIIYVLLGTALEYGIPIGRVFAEVHRSNMAKMFSDGTVRRRDDGKILKPESWTPPDIRGVLGSGA